MARGPSTEALRGTLALFDSGGPPMTTTEIAESLGLGHRTAYERLERLVDRGRLATKEVGGNGRVWWRPPQVSAPETMSDSTEIGNGTDSSRAVEDTFPLATVLDTVEVGVFVLDSAFDIAWVDTTIERYFGLDREEVIGRDKRELIYERIRDAVAEPSSFTETVLATYDDNSYTETFECRVTSGENREERWLEHRSRPIETGPFAGGRVELYYDITDRKRTEQALRESEHRFRSLVDAVEEYAIFLLDADGIVTSWNEGAQRIKGYAEDEVLGEHFSVFYTEDDRRAGVPEANLEAAREAGSVETEGWRVRANGSEFWAHVTITAVHDDDGSLQGYAKVTRDMTNRRRAEAEHRLLYETTSSIAEAETVRDGLEAALQDICQVTDWEYAEAWLPTGEGTIRRADADYFEEDLAAFAEFSEGYTFESSEGLPGRVYASGEVEWEADLTSGSRERYPRLVEAHEVGMKASVGVPVIADGEVHLVLTFVMREVKESDEWLVDLVSSVATELGELLIRRQAERDLQRERNLTDRILQTAPVGIAVFSADGGVVRTNDRIADILGLSPDEAAAYVVGDRTLHDEHGEPLPFESRPLGRVLDSGEPVFDQEIRVPLPNGSSRWVSVNAVPITDETGDLVRVITTATDVTQIKEQARQLERRQADLEAELEELYQRISDGLLAVDDEWRITHVNRRAEELLGRQAGDLFGENLREAFSEGVGETALAEYERAMETQEPVSFETDSSVGGGWIEVNAYPSETGLSIYFRDVTARVERQRKLERYETIVETVWDGVYALDEHDRFVLVNDAFCDLVGYEREELLGEHPTLVNSEAVNEAANEIETRIALGEEEVGVLEYEFVRSDGESVPVETRFGPVEYGDGRIGRCGVARDISQRREYKRKLQSRARQQKVVSELGKAALKDPDLDALFRKAVRRVAETLDTEYCWVLDLDADADELLLRQGAGCRDEIAGNATVSAAVTDSQASHALRAEEPVVVTNLETETRFPGAELLASHGVKSGISTIIGSSDEPWGVLGTHDTEARSFTEEDVDFVQSVANILAEAIERREYRDELQELIGDLRESNERLEQFAYVASHDLKEPLRMITNYLSLIEERYEDALDEDGREFLAFAVDGAERMRAMIDDLLRYSRVDTEAEPMGPVDCNTVVEDALGDLHLRIEETDAEISVGSLPTVMADRKQLTQVFQNLISNAIKYQDGDRPRVEIDAERNAGVWMFSVTDNGIGIPLEQRDRIFEVFRRLHTQDEYSGTGIGLALCKKIVERHGGDIWVESEADEGSTFSFTIPTTAANRSSY